MRALDALLSPLDTARALPELAVLSTVMHGHDDGAAAIGLAALEACREIDSPRGRLFTDIILESLGDLARIALEKLMNVGGYQYPQSDFVKKHFYDGQREQLARLLGRKFGDLPADVVKRIETAEPDELARWSNRFADGASLQAIFATDTHSDNV